jgi:hypothetical protein
MPTPTLPTPLETTSSTFSTANCDVLRIRVDRSASTRGSWLSDIATSIEPDRSGPCSSGRSSGGARSVVVGSSSTAGRVAVGSSSRSGGSAGKLR